MRTKSESAMAAVVPAAALVPVQTARLEHLSGLPRGAVSEVTGARSSGRTSFLNSVLAEATSREEYCAVVDASDHFDPFSAARAGVALERLVWVVLASECSAPGEVLRRLLD